MSVAVRCLRSTAAVLDRLTKVIAAGLLSALLLVTITAVVYRYVLHSPLSWSVEVQTTLFVWLTFLGAAIAMAGHEHSGFTDLVTRMPRPIQIAVLVASAVAVTVFLLIIIRLGFAALPRLAGQTTPALGISVVVNYLALPVGMSLMLVQFLATLTRSLLAGGPGEESEGLPI
jgi:TRAP-type C4-dicarboxylate transport system permease small subunit